MIFFLCACGNTGIPKIEEYIWSLESVQGGDEKNGGYVACSPEMSDKIQDLSIPIIEIECKAQNGVITLNDKTNNKTYSGSYKVKSKDLRSIIYEITINSKQGLAVSAMTDYYDGSQTPTFIISIDGYALNFYSRELQ